MDTDWCLNCERAVLHDRFGPYCSPECLDAAGLPLPSPAAPSPWSGTNLDAIYAWAADIEPTSPLPGPSSPPPSPRRSKPPSLRPSVRPLPALMRSKQRPAPPALCISTPRPALPSPSRPIFTPPHSRPTEYVHDKESLPHRASFQSAATESTLATPLSASIAVPITPANPKTSIFAALAHQVCSWVAPIPLLPSPKDGHPFQTFEPSIKPPFTVVAHTRPSPAFDVDPLHIESEEDGASWHLSRAVLVDPPPLKKMLSIDFSRTHRRKLFHS